MPQPLLRPSILLSLAAITLYLAATAYYALGPTLGGHGESSVVCTAWQFRMGRPVYPAPDAPQRTAMVYGPMEPALLAAILYTCGPHLAPLKAAGGIIALLALLACWRVFRRLADPAAALLALGWLALVYLKYTLFTYYLRPDSALQLCVALCLFATFCLRKNAAWILFALALAWGINLKITMPIYVFPLLFLFRQRHGITPLLLALASAALLAAVPFLLFPQVSLANYLNWLTMASAEGTESTMILPVSFYLILLTTPAAAIILLFALRQPAEFRQLARRHRPFAIASAITFLLVLRITGKPGAGPPHLLPLFPILGLVLAKSLQQLLSYSPRLAGGNASAPKKSRLPITATSAAGLLALAALLAFDLKAAALDIFAAYPWSTGNALTSEITTLAEKFPRQPLSMAPGSSPENYPELRYLPVLVLRDNPYILDIPAMMDMQKAGRQIPPSTRDYIAAGTCPLWLVPRNETPFTLRNWYQPRAPIFDAPFRQSFLDHYKIIDHTEHFDLWQYHPE